MNVESLLSKAFNSPRIESADLRSVFIEKDGADPNKQPWLEIICLSCQKTETLYPLLTTVLTIKVYTKTIKFTSELLRFLSPFELPKHDIVMA